MSLGEGNDLFHLSTGISSPAAVTGTVEFDAGLADTISYQGNTGPITVAINGNLAGTATSSYASYITGDVSGFEYIVGSDYASATTENQIGDSLYDNTGASLVLLTATNQGTINDIDFSSIENLELRTGADTITFLGTAILPGAVAGRADGGGIVGAAYENGVYSSGTYIDSAADLLDYTSYLAGGITVDFSANKATGIFSNQAGGLISGDGSIQTVTQDSSFENVDGSSFDDTIIGDDQPNVLHGFGGEDTILGLAGDDTIDGGDGTSGADGADLIAAGDGADLIRASNGSDLISGGGYVIEGTDFIAIDDGSSDTLTYIDENEGLDISLTGIDKGTVQADSASSLSVGNFLTTYNSDINHQLISVPSNQTSTDWTDTYGDIQNLELTIKSDIVRFDVSDINTGVIDASAGALDTLDYSSFGPEDSVLVNLSNAVYLFDFDANEEIVANDGEITLANTHAATNIRVDGASAEGGTDGVFGFEAVIGGAADDAIVGNDSDNLLVGNAGDDRIAGGAGADTIYGGTGDDFINPGDGADYVAGGAGMNTIAITSSDLAEDFFVVDRNGINIFKLEGDGTQTSAISAPTGRWNPGAQGIDLLDGGDPVDTGTGTSAVTTYDTIYGTAIDDEYELGGTALKNVGSIDLGTGDDYIGTAATTKGILVNYDGNSGTDFLSLNFTFGQFAKLHSTGKYVLDVQQYLDNTSGQTFSSSQVDFTATNFEAGGVSVITPGVYNMLQGDPAALTFNSAFGIRNSSIVSGNDVTLSASALTNSTATALSEADIVSAFVEASSVKGTDASSVASGGSITGNTTASQDASALSRTVADRADSVLAAYGLGTDRSNFTAADDLSLTLSGNVKADTSATSGGFVVNASGTVEVAGSRDSTFNAGEALNLAISANGLQTVGASNIEGLSIAGLASRAYGIDDADQTNSSNDTVQSGADLTLNVTASTNNKVTAQTVGNESLGTLTLVDLGAAATDRFRISQVGANFPLINGDRIRFSSSDTSVEADRDYYVLNIIPATGEFQLSSEPDGSPVNVLANGTLQAYRPAVATADAISTVSAVDLNPSASLLTDIQSGAELTLLASAVDQIVANATSVVGDATAGLFRLGGLDNLDLPAAVSIIQALADTNTVAGGDATFQLSATDNATLTASSTDGAALTEGNAQVFGSVSSNTTAGDALHLTSNANLHLSGTSTSTSGSAEARSGAGAGAGVTTPGTTLNDSGTVQPSAASYAMVTAVDSSSQGAGSDLVIQANATNSLNASATTVSGSGNLGSVWTSAAGNILATFDLNADTTVTTPSFVGAQTLADGQLVQLPVASAGLLANTDYAVKLLGFGAVDDTLNTLTMPTGITYALNDAVRFRLNSTTPANSANSRYGIELGTTYYVSSPLGNTFKLSASPNGPPIDLVQDDLGPDDQLVDVDRFQLLIPPLAPGGTYTVAALTPRVSGISLTLPSVANAFAGSREADLTLSSSDSINLAQVSGISGNGALTSLLAGGEAIITAMADGVIDAMARNIANDATASAGMVAEGISDTTIAAGSDGSVIATARLNALVDAVTTGDSADLDNSLANLNITARGVSASAATNDITISASGDVAATASLLGRSSATTVTGNSDALAVLEASGLEALSNDFMATIGQQGDITAVATIGSLASPLLISALSAGAGDSTAQTASDAVGILGSYNAGVFSNVQAGTSQGDINGSASANLELRAIASDGVASVILSDVPGSGSSSVIGIQDMALTVGAEMSRVSASATGVASLLAQSVQQDATSQSSTTTAGLLSTAATALPVSFLDQGSIAVIANQRSFSQAISVAGSSSSDLNNRSVGMANTILHFAGIGTIAADALSQQEGRAQSVAGHVTA
ncbi:MAG: beta strand repeat-containing protein [Cyanobacteriota bacterium]